MAVAFFVAEVDFMFFKREKKDGCLSTGKDRVVCGPLEKRHARSSNAKPRDEHPGDIRDSLGIDAIHSERMNFPVSETLEWVRLKLKPVLCCSSSRRRSE